jgi:hypothetical protein
VLAHHYSLNFTSCSWKFVFKAEELLRSLDTSGDGEVNWSEFMAAIEQIESDLYDRYGTAVHSSPRHSIKSPPLLFLHNDSAAPQHLDQPRHAGWRVLATFGCCTLQRWMQCCASQALINFWIVMLLFCHQNMVVADRTSSLLVQQRRTLHQ